MHFLLSNDDGIHAPGLRTLYAAIKAKGHRVTAVAPMTEQSAVSHGITVFRPLQSASVCDDNFGIPFEGTGVYGTPADCVKLALTRLLPSPPDIVISGINSGANAGPNVPYSGTIAAAAEGAFHALPSMAVSYDSFKIEDISEHAAHAVTLAETLPWHNVPKHTLININYPHRALQDCLGVRVCPQSSVLWQDDYEERRDLRKLPYWWLSGTLPAENIEQGSDNDLLSKGHITVTPLRFVFTDEAFLAELNDILKNIRLT